MGPGAVLTTPSSLQPGRGSVSQSVSQFYTHPPGSGSPAGRLLFLMPPDHQSADLSRRLEAQPIPGQPSSQAGASQPADDAGSFCRLPVQVFVPYRTNTRFCMDYSQMAASADGPADSRYSSDYIMMLHHHCCCRLKPSQGRPAIIFCNRQSCSGRAALMQQSCSAA